VASPDQTTQQPPVAGGQPAASGAGQGPTGSVDDIIVIAQRRSQNLQDLPIVVTTVNRQLLQDQDVMDITDLAVVAPGLLVTSTSSEAPGTFGGILRFNY
jgi:outer membrane receptor protein involved in Fe transport